MFNRFMRVDRNVSPIFGSFGRQDAIMVGRTG